MQVQRAAAGAPAGVQLMPGRTKMDTGTPGTLDSTPTPHPFDAVAVDYDETFSRTQLGQWLREAVRRQIIATFQPGQHLLELGCGTGEDALWLARRGIQVTATDVSSAMLNLARNKAHLAGLQNLLEFAHLDLSQVGRHGAFDAAPASFDGAFSNFGPLNCLADRRELTAGLAKWVRPGGHLVLVVMGPVCPWEIAWYASHGKPKEALRRFRGGVESHLAEGHSVRVWYPSPGRLSAEFRPYFRRLHTVGIGVLLPPSYLDHLVDRWPKLFSWLARAEQSVAGWFPWTWLNDHYLMILERR